jgi:hypothetical protein
MAVSHEKFQTAGKFPPRKLEPNILAYARSWRPDHPRLDGYPMIGRMLLLINSLIDMTLTF